MSAVPLGVLHTEHPDPADLLKAALRYASFDWPVFPLHSVTLGPGGARACTCRDPECHSPAKHPRTKKGFEDATADFDQIKRWWAEHPLSNVGIRTGEASGLYVLDVDTPKGGAGSLQHLEATYGDLPTTFAVLTGGGGMQFYFAYPGGNLRNTGNALGAGLDTRGEGGYVAAPPSLHVSGRLYLTQKDAELAPVPGWLLELLNEKGIHRAEPIPEDLVVQAGHGRNNWLASVAGTMRRRGMARDSMFAALMEENRIHCQPPLSEREVRKIADSIGRYKPEDPPTVNSETAEETEREIVFVSLREFVQLDFPQVESLVGQARNGTNLLPRYGWVMPWGPAGAAKTSILTDLCFHAAEGRTWLQYYPVARPLRMVMVVNEGVPGALQDKFREKLEVWDGDTEAVLDSMALYVSPWGEFSFREQQMSEHLQAFARDFQADYVVADPLHSLGTVGAGAPEDTEGFKHLLRKFGLWDWIGIITTHHANKAGTVSGDWPRHPDTVFRLEKEGKRPATKFTLEKARPADPEELGVPVLLNWLTDTKGYERQELDVIKVSDAELIDRIVSAVANEPGLNITQLRERVSGDTKRVSELAKSEVAGGRLRNLSDRKNGWEFHPPGETGLLHGNPETREEELF